MDVLSSLRQCELFSSLDTLELDALAELAQPRELRGGAVLFEVGSPSDSLYLVVTGRLNADLPDGTLAEIGVGETVGEVGVVANEPRLATVRAMRDSLLLRFRADQLMPFLARYPDAFLALSRVIIDRLRYDRRQQRRASLGLRSLTVVAVTPDAAVDQCVAELVSQLSSCGRVRLITADGLDEALGAGASDVAFGTGPRNEEITAWLHEQEADCDLLVYSAGPAAGAWLRRSLRQADRVLVAASGAALQNDTTREIACVEIAAPIEVLMKRSEEAQPLQWRELLSARAHYWWRPGEPDDVASLARQLTARGLGLVLGGGGARGFAHIGVIRALQELQIPVDLAGGSSMGAFMSAMLACGMDAQQMMDTTRDTFVRNNYLNDYMLPRVSLIRGRRILARLREVFGERLIEEMAMPYFCVSASLTSGTTVVHDQGSLAVWVGTSMCVPGVAPPVGYRGELLADGGVVNSLPTDVMLQLGRGPILASSVSTAGVVRAPGVEGPDPDVLFHWKADIPRPSLIDILFRTSTLTSESGNRARAECADIVLNMPVSDVGMFDWESLDALAELGYAHAMRSLEPQRDVLLKPELCEPLI